MHAIAASLNEHTQYFKKRKKRTLFVITQHNFYILKQPLKCTVSLLNIISQMFSSLSVILAKRLAGTIYLTRTTFTYKKVLLCC